MKNITFIYAGAGSGKTHKLTSLLTDFIQNDLVSASQVMLTTFTKKASNDIKERAQSELLKNKLFKQANELNQAYIGTVHSVGYQFIKKYWYLIGISPDIKEIGENEKDIFFSQAISEIPSDKELAELNRLVQGFNFHDSSNNFAPLKWNWDVKTIMDLALTNQVDLEKEDASLVHSLHQFNSMFKGELTSKQLLSNLKVNLAVYFNNPLTKSDYDLAEKLAVRLAKIKDHSVIDLEVLNDIGSFDVFLNKIYGPKTYLSIFNQLQTIDISQTVIFQKVITSYTSLIFDIAKRSLKKYSDFKKEKGLVDYTDMEVYFLNLLDIEEVRLDIQQTLKLVMVDEFQDSNPIQLSIFMKLSELVDQSYWVGDPKQAIYGFRGADPVLIDEVMRKFTTKNDANLKVEILKMSWRSDEKLVSFSNSIFQDAMSSQVADIYLDDISQINGKKGDANFENWRNTISYQPITGKETIALFPARNTDQKMKGFEALNFWNVLKDGGDKENGRAANPLFHSVLAEKLKNLLNDSSIQIFDKSIGEHRKIKGSDICLLVRVNQNVVDLASELKRAGVAVNASIPGLTKTIEYRFVKNIATLFLDRNNALAKTELAFLNGDVDNWSDLIKSRLDFVFNQAVDLEDLELREFMATWLKENDFNTIVTILQGQSKHLSVAFIIREIINQFNLFLKTASFGNVAVRQSNLIRLIELVDEYEAYCIKMNIGTGLNGYFNFIESSSKNDMQSVNANEDAIQIMTYHKSKGLEWPIVLLLGLDNNPFSRDEFFKKNFFKSSVLSKNKIEIENPLKDRVIEFLWWPFGTKKTLNDSLEFAISKTPQYTTKHTLISNETKRLLYVGITRSRDSIVFAFNAKKSLNWIENVISGFDFNTAYSEFNLGSSVTTSIDLFKIEQPVKFQQFIVDKVISHTLPFEESNYFKKLIPAIQDKPFDLSPSKQKPTKVSTLIELETIHNRLNFKSMEVDLVGNTLHSMLYLRKKSNFKNSVVRLNENNGLALDVDLFIENTQKFDSYLNDTFSILNQYPEMYLEKMIGDKKAVGEADLVLELENELILIDYKSFPGKKEEIFTSSSEFFAGKYSGQLDTYSDMLSDYFSKPVTRKIIYYVVQGVLVELK